MSDLLLEYRGIALSCDDEIAIVTINRPKQANALSFELMQDFIKVLDDIAENKNCRAVIVRGEGKHFSAGADLGWMKAAAQMTEEQNFEEALVLTEMYEKLYHLPQATLVCVSGAAYGGALGLISACDIVLASENARFCLSEVNLGLVPAVILPYVARRLNPGDLRRLSVTGAPFSAAEAKAYGLVNHVVPANDFSRTLDHELGLILSSAPGAISSFKDLYHKVCSDSCQQSKMTAQSIAKVRVGAEAQHGLSSFFAKQKPSWVLTLNRDWMIDEDH